MSRLIIADAGSTKIHWALVETGSNDHKYVKTPGVNPVQDSDENIINIFKEAFSALGEPASVGKIYYYGAGCGSSSFIEKIKTSLSKTFNKPETEVNVNSDMLGAARGLFGREAGIACILGTGSNVCLYDGFRIVDNVPSLGYVLGDDGSGAALGKRFLGDLYKRILPEKVMHLFEQEYHLSLDEIISTVYRHPRPSGFLASFAPFLLKNKGMDCIKKILNEEFQYFFSRNLLNYQTKYKLPIRMTGSIAYNFRDLILEIAVKNSIEIGKIIAEPLEGLIDYHLSLRDKDCIE